MKSLAAAALIALAVAFAAESPAFAQVAVPSLYSTGVGVSGGLLPEGSADPHYTLVASPSGSELGPTPFVTFTNQSPINSGEWMANGPASNWLTPGSAAAGWQPAGDYTYRTTFDLTGFDPSSTSITMRVAADNNVVVYLNGTPTGITLSQQAPIVFGEWSTIATGFQPGVNTFDFVVTNTAPLGVPVGPTGFRAEMIGSTTPVPEPVGMMFAAGVVLAALGFRRRSATRG